MTLAPGDLARSIRELEEECEVGDWHPVSGRLHPNNQPPPCTDESHEHVELKTWQGRVVSRICTPGG